MRIFIVAIFISAFLPRIIFSDETPSSGQAAVSESKAQPHSICYFVPPSGWEIAKLVNPSPYIQIGFIGKGSTLFRPSINLALEEVDVNLKEYVKAVKEIHLSDPNTKCRDLGKFEMQAGEGRLLDITCTTAHGEIKQFQGLFVKDNIAYILTIAVLKEDLPKYQSEMIKSIQSLSLIPDLYTPLADPQQRTELKDFFVKMESDLPQESKKKQLEEMQKRLVEKYSQIGPHWQFLVLNEGVSKINQSQRQNQDQVQPNSEILPASVSQQVSETQQAFETRPASQS